MARAESQNFLLAAEKALVLQSNITIHRVLDCSDLFDNEIHNDEPFVVFRIIII